MREAEIAQAAEYFARGRLGPVKMAAPDSWAVEEVKIRCTAEWGWRDFYGIHAYCGRQQFLAAEWVHKVMESTGAYKPPLTGTQPSDANRVALGCVNQSKDTYGIDYRVLVRCLKQKMEALERSRSE